MSSVITTCVPPLAGQNSYALVELFSVRPGAASCGPTCKNLDRENVTWCVRIADVNRTIETCVSFEDGEEVYKSTCDAEPLNLKAHLSLPDVRPHCYSCYYPRCARTARVTVLG